MAEFPTMEELRDGNIPGRVRDLERKTDAMLKDVLKAVYSVGSIYISTVSTNPATLFKFGTWAAFGTGRTIVGIDSGDTSFDTSEETGGSKTHALTQAELPNVSTGSGTAHTHVQNSHNHTQDAHGHNIAVGTGPSGNTVVTYLGDSAGGGTLGTANATATNQAQTATNQNESVHTHSLGGSGTAHNNLQPYIVVYMLKRTA